MSGLKMEGSNGAWIFAVLYITGDDIEQEQEQFEAGVHKLVACFQEQEKNDEQAVSRAPPSVKPNQHYGLYFYPKSFFKAEVGLQVGLRFHCSFSTQHWIQHKILACVMSDGLAVLFEKPTVRLHFEIQAVCTSPEHPIQEIPSLEDDTRDATSDVAEDPADPKTASALTELTGRSQDQDGPEGSRVLPAVIPHCCTRDANSDQAPSINSQSSDRETDELLRGVPSGYARCDTRDSCAGEVTFNRVDVKNGDQKIVATKGTSVEQRPIVAVANMHNHAMHAPSHPDINILSPGHQLAPPHPPHDTSQKSSGTRNRSGVESQSLSLSRDDLCMLEDLFCLRHEDIPRCPKGSWLGLADLHETFRQQHGMDLVAQDSQYQLGVCYELGIGVAIDFAGAFRNYKAAAAKKDQYQWQATCMLGRCYQLGKGTDRDPEEAVRLYRAVATNSTDNKARHRAIAFLGECYLSGHGVPQDFEKGLHYARAAAEQNDFDGMWLLGICCHNGLGCHVDVKTACHLYRRAARVGHPGALSQLGFCYSEGVGVECMDPNEALALYLHGAEQGDPTAHMNIARCYEEGIVLSKNTSKGLWWLRQAAIQGCSDAQYSLARYYKPRKLRSAIEFYVQALERGNPYAEQALLHLFNEKQEQLLQGCTTDVIAICRSLSDYKESDVLESYMERNIPQNCSVRMFLCGTNATGKAALMSSIEKRLHLIPAEHPSDTLQYTPVTLRQKSCPVSVLDLPSRRDWHTFSFGYLSKLPGSCIFVVVSDLNEDAGVERENVLYWLRYISTVMMGHGGGKAYVIMVGTYSMSEDPGDAFSTSEWGKDLVFRAQKAVTDNDLLQIHKDFLCVNCLSDVDDRVDTIINTLRKYRLYSIADSPSCVRARVYEPATEITTVLEAVRKRKGLQRLSLCHVTDFVSEATDLELGWARDRRQVEHVLKVAAMLGTVQYLPDDGWIIIDPNWLLSTMLDCNFAPKSWAREVAEHSSALRTFRRSRIERQIQATITDGALTDDVLRFLIDMKMCYEVVEDSQLMFPALLKARHPHTIWQLDSGSFPHYAGVRLKPQKGVAIVPPHVLPQTQVEMFRQQQTGDNSFSMLMWNGVIFLDYCDTDSLYQVLVLLDKDMRHVDIAARCKDKVSETRSLDQIISRLYHCLHSAQNAIFSVWESVLCVMNLDSQRLRHGAFEESRYVSPVCDKTQKWTVLDVLRHDKAMDWRAINSRLVYVANETPDRPATSNFLEELVTSVPMHVDSVKFLRATQPTVTFVRNKASLAAFEPLMQLLQVEFQGHHDPGHFLYPQWEQEEFQHHPCSEEDVVVQVQSEGARQWRHDVLAYVFRNYPAMSGSVPSVRIQPVFIGVSCRQVAEQICAGGFPTKKSRTSGWYGHGTYCTLDLEYAYFYANGTKRAWNREQHPCVIVALAMFANPLPVIENPVGRTPGITFSVRGPNGKEKKTVTHPAGENVQSFYGQPEQSGYDCHIAVVKKRYSYQEDQWVQLTPIRPEEWNLENGVVTELVMMDRLRVLPIALLDFDKPVGDLHWVAPL